MERDTAVPMTAGEAADALIAKIDRNPATVYRYVVQAFMNAHWPQPVSGQVTGRALFEAFYKTAHQWEVMPGAVQDEWNAAAARLAAPQGVGQPLDAFEPIPSPDEDDPRAPDTLAVDDAWLLAEKVYTVATGYGTAKDRTGTVATILRERMRRAPQGVAFDVEAASKAIVERFFWNSDHKEKYAAEVAEMLADLRARLAAPQGVVVDDTAVQVGMSAYKTGFRDGEKAAQKAMDADALAQEIMAYVYPPSGDLSATKANIAACIRRHTPSVAAGRVDGGQRRGHPMTAPAVPMTAARTEFDCTNGDGARLSLIFDVDGVELRNKCRGKVVGVHVDRDNLPALITSLSRARHWPQPVSGQAVTADDILREVSNQNVVLTHNGDSYISDEMYAALTRAAARLAAPQGVAATLTHDRAIAAAYRHVVDMIDASTDTEPDVALSRLRHYFDLLADTHRDSDHTPSVAAGREVGFDVDAVAAEIAAHVYRGKAVVDYAGCRGEIAAILRRHTPSVAAGREVVEVTDDEIEIARQRGMRSHSTAYHLNEMLRARAGTAGVVVAKREAVADTMDELFALMQAYSVVGAIAQDDAEPRESLDPRMSAFDTMRFLDAIIQRSKKLPDAPNTAPQWITRPAPQEGALPSPRSHGVAAETNIVVEYESGAIKVYSAERVSEYVSNGLRHDAVRWCIPGKPWIERTATAGGWTAEVCEVCVGKWVIVDHGSVYTSERTAEQWAFMLNHDGCEQITVIEHPPVEAQP